MRLVVQRVSSASVAIEGTIVGRIGNGLVVLVGIRNRDGIEQVDHLADKLAHLRVFADADGKMNRSVMETGGSLLVVSQFTLYGDCRKGRRPSFTDAAAPDAAIPLYERFLTRLRQSGLTVQTGHFGAMMQVELTNDGPVTLILESDADDS